MKDITTIPTADLIAEWKNKENVYVDEEDYRDEMGEPIENAAQLYADADAALDAHWIAIAAELDSRLDKAGITMYENQFIYTKADAWTALDRVGEEYIALAADLPAKEQHDLETWLLIKNTP